MSFFYGSFFLIFEPLAPNGVCRYLNEHGLNYLNIELSKTSALLSLWASLSTGFTPMNGVPSMFTFLFIILTPYLASPDRSWITCFEINGLDPCCLCPPLLPPSVWLTGLLLFWPAEQEPASGLAWPLAPALLFRWISARISVLVFLIGRVDVVLCLSIPVSYSAALRSCLFRIFHCGNFSLMYSRQQFLSVCYKRGLGLSFLFLYGVFLINRSLNFHWSQIMGHFFVFIS